MLIFSKNAFVSKIYKLGVLFLYRKHRKRQTTILFIIFCNSKTALPDNCSLAERLRKLHLGSCVRRVRNAENALVALRCPLYGTINATAYEGPANRKNSPCRLRLELSQFGVSDQTKYLSPKSVVNNDKMKIRTSNMKTP